MNILLTNDDGYAAEGLKALKAALSIRHSVYTIAPLRQMSATSHAITLFKPMELVMHSACDYALDGTPADCVKVGLAHVYSGISFDLVVSGINNGPNMGEDIFYSGTVAGAREGLMNGVPGIALSQEGWNTDTDYTDAARVTAEIIGRLKPESRCRNLLLNINFPRVFPYRGVMVTHLGKRLYKDFIEVQEQTEPVKTFVTVGGEYPAFHDHPGSDLNAVSDGYVSITPLPGGMPDCGGKTDLQEMKSGAWSFLQENTHG